MQDTTSQTIARLYSEFGTSDFEGNWVAQDWTLKDKVGYASSNLFQFFANPAGSMDPNLNVQKKHEQANFLTPNQIGGQNFFIVQNIRLAILNSAKARQLGTGVATDTYFSARQLQFARLHQAISSQGVLRWSVNQRTILAENSPFQTFSAGFGLGEVVPPSVGYTDGTPAAINGGANAYAACSPYDLDGGVMGDPFKLWPIVVLAPSTVFTMNLEFPVAASPSPANIYGTSTDQTATVWLACYLDGQLVRPRS